MKLRTGLLLLPALHVCAASADDGVLHTLRVVAEVPAVLVAPQPAERHLFELPSLDYVFSVEARCHDDWQPESLLLNVADSRISKTGADLKGNAPQQLELRIPAKQLAPIAMRNFCVIDVAEEGSAAQAETTKRQLPGAQSHMTVSAALSAHASLRCSLGDKQKTVYISQPLDVRLTCEADRPTGGVMAP